MTSRLMRETCSGHRSVSSFLLLFMIREEVLLTNSSSVASKETWHNNEDSLSEVCIFQIHKLQYILCLHTVRGDNPDSSVTHKVSISF